MLAQSQSLIDLVRCRGRPALSRLLDGALDLLFPPSCAACGRDGAFLCAECEPGLPRLEQPYCELCAGRTTGAVCSWCMELPPTYDGVRAPYLFVGAARDMVHNLKYRNIRASAPDLGRLLAAYLGTRRLPADVLVPVPLHRRRERERGYNQSALLARELGKLTGIPVTPDVLRRSRDTPPQVTLEGHVERRRNIEGAFDCVGVVAGQAVLLVDDVVTTGSTMSACAEPLKAAGATSVWGLALAR